MLIIRSTDQNILYPMEVNTALKAHKHCIMILLDINLCTIPNCIQYKYYYKKGHPLRVEDTYIYMVSSTGTFHRDCVLASFHKCRRHALF